MAEGIDAALSAPRDEYAAKRTGNAGQDWSPLCPWMECGRLLSWTWRFLPMLTTGKPLRRWTLRYRVRRTPVISIMFKGWDSFGPQNSQHADICGCVNEPW